MKQMFGLGCIVFLSSCAVSPAPSSSSISDWALFTPSPEESVVQAEQASKQAAQISLISEGQGMPLRPEFRLHLPVDCQLGETCWIAQYPDVNSKTKSPPQDYKCGTRSYAGHTGTDFAVADLRAIRRGVAVLAPADGVVVAVRDGETDDVFRQDGKKALKGRSCGNGVRLRHIGVWGTQFCHLRMGSVRVRPGQTVRAGTVLGMIGMSGLSEFPHVHMRFMRGLTTIDPFTGLAVGKGCNRKGTVSFWDAQVQQHAYAPASLYAVGFADGKVRKDEIWSDVAMPHRKPTRMTPLVGWAAAYGLRKKMVVRIQLTGPKGQDVMTYDRVMKRDRNWSYVNAGRYAPKRGWPAGKYVLAVSVLDGGNVIARHQKQMVMK